MANGEHLALLRQGVDAWNKWRADNRDIRPNLSFATGKGINIRGAKLSGVDLSRTNLSRADLSRTDLMGANLTEAYLKEAYLSEADLTGANLTNADFTSADLISANLMGANLSNAYLSGADLSKANLSGADLISTKLIGAYLRGTNLSGASLRSANLSGAYLKAANFKGANLKGANFTRANLAGVNLQRVKALDSNFNKAILTGACLENWETNSTTNLDEVICDYVYLQADQKERSPKSGNFAPGEFTRLFQKALETVDFIFRNGIDWLAFLIAFQKLQVESRALELSIQALENKSNTALVIRINVPPHSNKAEIENYLKREYENELQSIDKEYRYQRQASYEQIAIYRQQSANLTEMVKLMGCRTINVEAGASLEDEFRSEASEDEQIDAEIGRLVDMVQDDSHPSSIQDDSAPEPKQSFTETAAKIQKLLQQLEKAYPITTPLEKQRVVMEVIERIESNPTLKAWLVGVLKEVSNEVLKGLIDHPLANVLLAALEGYRKVD